MDKLIGKILGERYIIKEIIGVGGMSVVYKAEDTLENRYVAVKVLKEEFTSEQKFRRRFLNESRAIAMLSHENIVDVVDVNFEGDIQYIVMENIEGITLKEYINSKGPLPTDEALGYTKQILSALKHAHERGVVHRDIKPQNIMLLADNKIKVTDFGIAHVSNFDTVTMSDMAIGSVHYISPEQAKGMPTDEKSDIYSTGVMLYEMITGRLPFESDTAVSVALMQVQKQAPRPSLYIPSLPFAVEQIILKAMQKKVVFRYQNAQEMLSDIDAYQENNNVIFKHQADDTSDMGTVIMDKVSGNEDETEKKLSSKQQLFRNRIFAICSGVAAGLVAVLIMAILIFTFGAERTPYLVVPALEGRNISDIKEDIAINKNFIIKEKEEYNDTAEKGLVIAQNPPPGKRYETGKEITVTVSKGKEETDVPNVEGLALTEASTTLLKYNLRTGEIKYMQSSKIDEGKVIKTDPAAGSKVSPNSDVVLYVSRADTENQKITVPNNLLGMTKEQVIVALSALKIKTAFYEGYSSTYETGKVCSVSPPSGTTVDPAGKIEIIISKGVPPEEPKPEVPDPDIEKPETPDKPVNPPNTEKPDNTKPIDPLKPNNHNAPNKPAQ